MAQLSPFDSFTRMLHDKWYDDDTPVDELVRKVARRAFQVGIRLAEVTPGGTRRLLAPHPDDAFKVTRINELMSSFADRFCSHSMQEKIQAHFKKTQHDCSTRWHRT